MTIGEKIRRIRKERNLTQKQLGDLCGMADSAIRRYEIGKGNPKFETLERIAKALRVPISDILPDVIKIILPQATPANIIPMPEMKKIPLIGSIACGAPVLAEEHIERYIDIPESIPADFALTCKGDSMINARIFDGDIVYIRQQEMVDNGEIAAILIDGEATLKRVKLHSDRIILEPENPQYRPLVYWGEEMNAVRILGKAIAFISSVR